MTAFPEAPVPAPDPLGIGSIALFSLCVGIVAGILLREYAL